jgi:hypothetical protein
VITPNETLCPAHLRESLNAYVLQGRETGGFLRAVLENNLMEAIGRADHANLALLPHIVAYVYNNVPTNVYGSKEAVDRHIAMMRKVLADRMYTGLPDVPIA